MNSNVFSSVIYIDDGFKIPQEFLVSSALRCVCIRIRTMHTYQQVRALGLWAMRNVLGMCYFDLRHS